MSDLSQSNASAGPQPDWVGEEGDAEWDLGGPPHRPRLVRAKQFDGVPWLVVALTGDLSPDEARAAAAALMAAADFAVASAEDALTEIKRVLELRARDV